MSGPRRTWASVFPWIWAAITMVMVVAFAAVAVALVRLEGCINDNLGKRSAPAQRDAAAYLLFIVSVNDLFHLPPGATPQDQQAAGEHFRVVVQHVKATLLADAIEKAQHPLGDC